MLYVGTMLRILGYLLFFGLLAGGGWYVWDRYPVLQEFIDEQVAVSELRTLEARFTAEELMDKHQKELLKGTGYNFLEPKLIFYPYLLMTTKFSTPNSATQEGVLLWSLMDGEMVLDTETWESTHGYEDCLLANATETDFRIIKMLMEAGGSLERDRLYQRLKADSLVVDEWLQVCKDKKLVVHAGSRIRLHLQKPHLETLPMTLVHGPLVAKVSKHSLKSKKKYSAQQICKLAQRAFGPEFVIRKTEQAYLPVYCIGVQNPDGTTLMTYWNALNGKRFQGEV